MLGFGDAQFVESVLDIVGDIVPILFALLGRLDVVKNIVKVDLVESGSPVWHGTVDVMLVRFEAEIEHPLRLAFHARNIFNDFTAQSAFRFEHVVIVAVVKAIFIITHLLKEFGVVRFSFFSHFESPNISTAKVMQASSYFSRTQS